jgi:hypothetical protein
MDMTWIAIAASLMMGLGAVLFFVFAVKRDYFRNIEEAKYQVFWSDLDENIEPSKPIKPINSIKEDARNGRGETRC